VSGGSPVVSNWPVDVPYEGRSSEVLKVDAPGIVFASCMAGRHSSRASNRMNEGVTRGTSIIGFDFSGGGRDDTWRVYRRGR